MKKLLSLLSMLIISGTSISTIIAVSPYKEEKTKLENINNKISKIKIVIEAREPIWPSGIVLNNKLYFGSDDDNVYEYDPATQQQKIVINTKGNIISSGIVFNNKLYFGSEDHNVYEYDPATEQQKIVIRTNYIIRSSGAILNNKLYFGSDDNNVYEYDPATEQQKIVIRANGSIRSASGRSSGVVLNNKLYFGSDDNNIYEYDPATEQQKIVIRTNGSVFSGGITVNNKLYFGSMDHNVYEYDSVTEQQKIVIKANGQIESSGLIFNNKLYFSSWDHNVYEYDPATEQQKIVIITNHLIRSSGVVFNNKLYFGSDDNNVYEYDPATEQQKIVIRTNGWIASSGIVFNNKLYFGSEDHNVYEYSEYYLNSNLGEINNNSNTVILNELNYLNSYLDISQLEIINKTNNSAIIKIKNNLNNGNNIINVRYLINNEQNKAINLNELIKKAIFFKFYNENFSLKFKEINYINTNNLNFKNIEVSRNPELLHKVYFKYVCFDKKTFVNLSTKVKEYTIPKCEYSTKTKLSFQIITGLNKQEQENQINDWNINIDDEIKLSDFIIINNKNSEIINILSNNFDLSNINKQEQEIILYKFNQDEYEISIDSKKRLEIKYSIREINIETILNLKQKITGIITAKIINDNNEEQIITLSIKEAMQILQKYSLLPDKIIINENNSITFNGKAKIVLTQETEPQLITKISQI